MGPLTLGLPRWLGFVVALGCATAFYFAVPSPHNPGFRSDAFPYAIRWDGAAWQVECPRTSDTPGTPERPVVMGSVLVFSSIKKPGRKQPVLWEDLSARIAVDSASSTMSPDQVTATIDGVTDSLADAVGSLRPGARAAVLRAPSRSGRFLWANLGHLALSLVVIAGVYGFVSGFGRDAN